MGRSQLKIRVMDLSPIGWAIAIQAVALGVAWYLWQHPEVLARIDDWGR